ncbi:MAG TPA: glutamate synthase-related protein [Clostridia bacterium]|nr:glutamate synthase-related protein [Clostridia bacterium]
MAYSPPLGSSITNTRMRTPDYLSPYSGMCAVCASNCSGLCEIGLSAVRGSEAIYPYMTDINQFASEKDYPLDFSHFNINGRVFGARGCKEDAFMATFAKADITCSFGLENKVPLKAPFVLPAMAKLNWQDYYAGAALAGVLVVIGEDVIAKDDELLLEDGKLVSSPLIEEMLGEFRKYDTGYGDIILQANYDDESYGVLDYAISKLGVKSVELKFGQGSKGIQGMGRVESLEKAQAHHKRGYLVYPDPNDPEIAENYEKGMGQVFEKIGKLPIWNEEILVKRVKELKSLGAQRVCFKVGPFDPEDLLEILKIASKAEVDLITFDGAGGGSGNSPTKMMNEWGMPTVYMESVLYKMLKAMKEKGYALPQIAVAGGFVMEDQVYKGLALGAPYIDLIGIGRGAMSAAMSSKIIGERIKENKIPKSYEKYGKTLEEIFSGYRELKPTYGEKTASISPGAVGVYSYLNRVEIGLKQLMALNRKFALKYISREDLVPLTSLAAEVSGLDTFNDKTEKLLEKL